MATLRDTINTEISELQAKVAQKQADLANLEAVAPDFLGQELEKIRHFFSLDAIKRQLGL